MAISPSTDNLITSHGLSLAKSIDPNFERTFGLISKMDLWDSHSDPCDLIKGESIQLRNKLIGVKCRTQREADEGMTIQQSLEDEEQFFRNHKALKGEANHHGIKAL